MVEDNSEFYWENIFVKVEDKLFCVPRGKFVQSSEVFADMFLLPSGPATRSEGQDRDHPIVLEEYKKDDFTCLLKVMYPTAECLISGRNLELHLKKEEWVSVLKLSTIWNMTKIRQYAIHWLSTNGTLSPIEKIILARAHRVGQWLYEAVTSLATCNRKPTLEDVAAVGWETLARILWIRDDARNLNTFRVRLDEIQCEYCSSSLSWIDFAFYSGRCGHITSGDAELTFYSASSSPIEGTTDSEYVQVKLREILCQICGGNLLDIDALPCRVCNSCLVSYTKKASIRVRVQPKKSLEAMIEEIFGKEIMDYAEPATRG